MMDLSTDSWVTETQSTLKGVTTLSLKGQHSRLRRAQAREKWYITKVSDDGHLIKPLKFVDQQELRCQKDSKLLSSIRSHAKQNTYIERQADHTKQKRKGPRVIFPKTPANRHAPVHNTSKRLSVEAPFKAAQKDALRYLCPYPLEMGMRIGPVCWLSTNHPLSIVAGCEVLNQPRAMSLLEHYQEYASKAWYPEAVESVLKWTRSNMILLYVILYCAAAHVRMVTNSSDCADIYYYRGQAIKITNKVLEDPVARISNETLGALCHLVVSEEMYGSHAAASVHRRGLERLFQLRRAVPGTSMNFLVRYILPLTNLRLHSESTYLTPISYRGRIPSHQSILRGEEDSSPGDPVFDVFSWLKDMPLKILTDLSSADNRISLVRVELEYSKYIENAHLGYSRSQQCWRLAALIYLHTIVAAPDRWHLLPRFEAHLIRELRDLLEYAMVYPEVAVIDVPIHAWILLFGGLHARGDDAAWFRINLRDFCAQEGLLKWADVKVLIKSLPWVHRDLETCLEVFYHSSGLDQE